jgi:hypothetical protein
MPAFSAGADSSHPNATAAPRVRLGLAETLPKFALSPTGSDALSRLFCWPSLDVPKQMRRRADALPGRAPRLPRRGRQNLAIPGGYERWVGTDGDITEGAWGITPSRFLFERARPQLVEVPAIWTSIPADRDDDELLEAIECIVNDHALPSPHLITHGHRSIAILWHLQPLHMPAALKADATPEERAQHERATNSFRRCIVDWKRAAIKLRLAFAPLGAIPHTMATVDEQLLEHIPFPLEPSSPLIQVVDLVDDPPRVLHVHDGGALRIADISRPLAAFDKEMWATLKASRPRRNSRTCWLESEASLAALQVTAPGGRHKAAVVLACACVWDGLTRDDSLALLRSWAAKCVNDGAFPWRRARGDELEHLLDWAQRTLRPGGPTPRVDDNASGRPASPLEAAAAAVLAVLAAADGDLSMTLNELRREAGLIYESRIAMRTFQRSLTALKAAGLIEQVVSRAGRTWLSTFRLVSDVALESHDSPGQKEESLWAPHPVSNLRGGEGDASPAGRGVRGEGHTSTTSGSAESETTIELDQIEGEENQKPENDLLRSSRKAARRRRQPRALPLPFSASAHGRLGKPPRRRRSETVPELTPAVVEAVAEKLIDPVVRRHLLDASMPVELTPTELDELLTEAHSKLVARPRVLADLVGALTRQAQRLLRLRAFAEVSRQHADARKRRRQQEPQQAQHSSTNGFAPVYDAVAAAEARLDSAARVDVQSLRHGHTEPVPTPPSSSPFALAYAAQAAAAARIAARALPLHEQPVVERARMLCDHDLSLVALEPRSKAPPEGTRWRNAQTTPARHSDLEAALLLLGNDAGLAIVCGPVSGLVVVDLDDETAVAWATTMLPPTPWRTKTNRGEHWFYRLPDGWVAPATLPYAGQLQAAGRYVVAPGSLHPDTGEPYIALGDWTASKAKLPLFNNVWLRSLDERRAARRKALE